MMQPGRSALFARSSHDVPSALEGKLVVGYTRTQGGSNNTNRALQTIKRIVLRDLACMVVACFSHSHTARRPIACNFGKRIVAVYTNTGKRF